jgi:hypothetical protein
MSGRTVTVTPAPQLSVVTMAPGFAAGTKAAHDTVTFAGQVIVGGAMSSTCITCAHVAELPQRSVAVYTLVSVRLFAQTKLLVMSGATVTVTAPAQLSEVTIAPVFGAGTKEAQATVTFAGQAMVGATLSNTRIVWAHVALLPQMSVAM